MNQAPITIAIHSFGQTEREALVADVRAGLTTTPKELPPRWFYDERGSELFEQITRLPEYYQTRTELQILRERATEIIAQVKPETIVELGAGASTKTRVLIGAGLAAGQLSVFQPFDVSETVVRESARALVEEFPGLCVYATIGEFATHLGEIPRLGSQLIAFLGSTIGNFYPDQRREFLSRVRSLLGPDDAFLLGVDLIKDVAQLEAAYDDAQGVTSEFNLNLLRVINRELEADFNLTRYQHVARYSSEHQRIEMYLRSRVDQLVRIPGAGLEVQFETGEEMRTEISAKFDRNMVEGFFGEAGLRLNSWYCDSHNRFALCLGAPV